MWTLHDTIRDFSSLTREDREKWIARANKAALTTFRYDEGMMVSDKEAHEFHEELRKLKKVHERLNLEEETREQVKREIKEEYHLVEKKGKNQNMTHLFHMHMKIKKIL